MNMREQDDSNWKFGIKAVRELQGGTCVSLIRPPVGVGEFVYQQGAITVRKEGYGAMAVFDSIGDARSFTNNEARLMFCLYRESSEEDRALWTPYEPARPTLVPGGTRFADEVWILDEQPAFT